MFITVSYRSNFLFALFSHRQCNYQLRELKGVWGGMGGGVGGGEVRKVSRFDLSQMKLQN